MYYDVDLCYHLTSVIRPLISMDYPSFFLQKILTWPPSLLIQTYIAYGSHHNYRIFPLEAFPLNAFPNRLNIFIKLYFSMWHAYQYGQGKLKLVKDLKTGQAHLRVSLIDKEEINDLGRVANIPSRSTNNEKIITKSISNQ